MAIQDFGRGVGSGLFGLATLPLLPADLALQASGRESYLAQLANSLGVPVEPKQGEQGKAEFLAGQGATAAIPVGLTRQVLSQGAKLAGITAPVGAAINTAVGMTTEDPYLRIAATLPTSIIAGVQINKLSGGRGNQTPKGYGDTGIPLTTFQSKGGETQGLKELRLRMNPESAETVNYFDLAQAASIDKFFNNIQKFSNNPNLSADKVSKGVYEAYKNYNNSLVTKLKNDGRELFGKAKVVGKDTVIPITNTRDSLQRLINGIDPSIPGAQERISNLSRILKEYPDAQTQFKQVKNPLTLQMEEVPVSTAAKGIDIDRLQQQLAAWGEAASTGSYKTVDNAAVGVSKGEARQAINALKADLDAAIKANVPGAKELKAARDAFSNNIGAIQKFNDKSLTKYFSKYNEEGLPPVEVVADKLTKIKPSERLDLMAVLKNSDPAIAESVRKQAFLNIYDTAYTRAAAAGQPNLDSATLLRKFGKLDPKEISYLFPGSELKDFQEGLSALQKVNRQVKTRELNNTQVERDIATTVGAVSGPQGKYATQVAQHVVAKLIEADPRRQALILFNPEGREALKSFNKGDFGKAKAIFDSLGYGGTSALAISGSAGATGREQEGQNIRTRLQGMSEEDLLKMSGTQPALIPQATDFSKLTDEELQSIIGK